MTFDQESDSPSTWFSDQFYRDSQIRSFKPGRHIFKAL